MWFKTPIRKPTIYEIIGLALSAYSLGTQIQWGRPPMETFTDFYFQMAVMMVFVVIFILITARHVRVRTDVGIDELHGSLQKWEKDLKIYIAIVNEYNKQR